MGLFHAVLCVWFSVDESKIRMHFSFESLHQWSTVCLGQLDENVTLLEMEYWKETFLIGVTSWKRCIWTNSLMKHLLCTAVARFDFSWGDEKYHQETLENLKLAVKNTRRLCAVCFLRSRMIHFRPIWIFSCNILLLVSSAGLVLVLSAFEVRVPRFFVMTIIGLREQSSNLLMTGELARHFFPVEYLFCRSSGSIFLDWELMV